MNYQHREQSKRTCFFLRLIRHHYKILTDQLKLLRTTSVFHKIRCLRLWQISSSTPPPPKNICCSDLIVLIHIEDYNGQFYGALCNEMQRNPLYMTTVRTENLAVLTRFLDQEVISARHFIPLKNNMDRNITTNMQRPYERPGCKAESNNSKIKCPNTEKMLTIRDRNITTNMQGPYERPGRKAESNNSKIKCPNTEKMLTIRDRNITTNMQGPYERPGRKAESNNSKIKCPNTEKMLTIRVKLKKSLFKKFSCQCQCYSGCEFKAFFAVFSCQGSTCGQYCFHYHKCHLLSKGNLSRNVTLSCV